MISRPSNGPSPSDNPPNQVIPEGITERFPPNGLEGKWRIEAPKEPVVRMRQKHMAPVVDQITAWNRQAWLDATPKGMLGIAIRCFDNQLFRLRQCRVGQRDDNIGTVIRSSQSLPEIE